MKGELKGSIVKRGNTYSIVYDAPYKLGKTRDQRWISGFKSEEEASVELARILVNQAETGGSYFLNNDNVTVKDFLLRWLDNKKDNVAIRTYERYEELMRLHVIPYIGDIKMKKIEPLIIFELFELLKKKIKNHNRKKVYRVLYQAFKKAVDLEIIKHNYVSRVDIPKVELEEAKIIALDDVKRLLDKSKFRYLHTMIMIGIHTGMRLGEILGLRWKDVDLKKKVISVRQSATTVKANEPRFDKPKTKNSRRDIKITDELVIYLEMMYKKQVRQRLKCGPLWQDYGLVCCREDGYPLNPRSVASRFIETAKQLGIEASFHTLRHTHASILISRGVPIPAVSKRLGHADPSITYRIYAHVMPGDEAKTVENLEDALVCLM